MARTSSAAIVAVIALALAGPPSATAQVNQVLHQDGWILAAAHAPGLQGSIWRTDLWVHAAWSVANVSLTFCRSNTDNSAAVSYPVTLSGGRQTVYLEDVVDRFLNIGDGAWLGAIHYTSDVPVQVWARVYSISKDGTKSYGQLVEGIPTADQSPDVNPWDSRDCQRIYAAKHTADGRFRVNVGVVNPTAMTTEFTILIWGTDGNTAPPGGTRIHHVTVPPLSMVQLTDPFAGVGGGDWSECIIQVKVETDGAGGFAYASVVDNATNDAYFVRGVKGYTPAEHAGLNCTAHTDGWILAATRSPGLKNSIWRTDLWVKTSSHYYHTVNLSFCRSGSDNTAVVPVELTTPDTEGVFYLEDVVEQFLHVGDTPWLGAIHYTSNIPVQVWARIYSISADGTKSYGQLVEGIPTVDASPAWPVAPSVDDLQYIYAAKHTASGRFRVNVGVVNPSPMTCSYRVAIFDSAVMNPGTGGCEPGVTVPPYSMVQLTDPFAAVDGGEWNDYVMQLLCDTPGGGGFLYASVVDNATNDAYFVRGIKLLPQ